MNLFSRGQILDRMAIVRTKAAKGLGSCPQLELWNQREVVYLARLMAVHELLFVAENRAAEAMEDMELSWNPWSIFQFALRSRRIRQLNQHRHRLVAEFDGAGAEPKRYGRAA